MSAYQCKSCGWRWRGSSFFAGVQGEGCPRCTSNMIDRIEEPEMANKPQSPDEVEAFCREYSIHGTERDKAKAALQALINKQKATAVREVLGRVEREVVGEDENDPSYNLRWQAYRNQLRDEQRTALSKISKEYLEGEKKENNERRL